MGMGFHGKALNKEESLKRTMFGIKYTTILGT